MTDEVAASPCVWVMVWEVARVLCPYLGQEFVRHLYLPSSDARLEVHRSIHSQQPLLVAEALMYNDLSL
eukprot:CAMPEP_0178417890 /NCGR_PEP_ID=MMETSP0689_2-20121128/24805_1 /TAXON_ID=160604 /ORGANISM="Amphidinium massartii, Strain CS-259" /LENGTH=68 /DNA_ID=CAMNT_0020039265 /DNA_START=150 /DNA_END=356 /DNA_ORIENTATION=-